MNEHALRISSIERVAANVRSLIHHYHAHAVIGEPLRHHGTGKPRSDDQRIDSHRMFLDSEGAARGVMMLSRTWCRIEDTMVFQVH
jgi:hypothetical protein